MLNKKLDAISKRCKEKLHNTYNLNPKYEKFVIDQIVFKEKSRLTSQFMEMLFWEETEEVMKKFYSFEESLIRLPTILMFLESNVYVFPNYGLLPEVEYIQENLNAKQRLIDEMLHYQTRAQRRLVHTATKSENEIFDLMNSELNNETHDYIGAESSLSDSIEKTKNKDSIHSLEFLVMKMKCGEKCPNDYVLLEEDKPQFQRKGALKRVTMKKTHKEKVSIIHDLISLLNEKLEEKENNNKKEDKQTNRQHLYYLNDQSSQDDEQQNVQEEKNENLPTGVNSEGNKFKTIQKFVEIAKLKEEARKKRMKGIYEILSRVAIAKVNAKTREDALTSPLRRPSHFKTYNFNSPAYNSLVQKAQTGIKISTPQSNIPFVSPSPSNSHISRVHYCQEESLPKLFHHKVQVNGGEVLLPKIGAYRDRKDKQLRQKVKYGTFPNSGNNYNNNNNNKSVQTSLKKPTPTCIKVKSKQNEGHLQRGKLKIGVGCNNNLKKLMQEKKIISFLTR